MSTDVKENLEARATQLRAEITTPTEREVKMRELREIESEIATRDRAALVAEAEKRLLGIMRAYTGLTDQLDQDTLKVLDAAKTYAARVAAMNDRWLKLGALKAEYDGLVDGFGVADAKPLPAVAIVPTRKEWLEAASIVANAGVSATSRTELHQIPESEGYALLKRAGKITK